MLAVLAAAALCLSSVRSYKVHGNEAIEANRSGAKAYCTDRGAAAALSCKEIIEILQMKCNETWQDLCPGANHPLNEKFNTKTFAEWCPDICPTPSTTQPTSTQPKAPRILS